MTEPDSGKTPSAPDVDQPDGGAHTGEGEQAAAGRTPDSPRIDEPETTP
ncbi:MAG: hypothetical protein LC789_01175 [Actinobacteria bacterium]|nr:hypothetical protein [Actinomycetota bacterium]MCA1722340.1 hypothetical protein [Actinomycetota bacterium]